MYQGAWLVLGLGLGLISGCFLTILGYLRASARPEFARSMLRDAATTLGRRAADGETVSCPLCERPMPPLVARSRPGS
jgi:hypothetical protein